MTQKMSHLDESDEQMIRNFVADIKKNYESLQYEWMKFLEERRELEEQKEDVLSVKRDDLSKLASEIQQLKINIPKVLNKSLTSSVGKVDQLQEALKECQKQNKEYIAEMSYLKARCDTAVSDCQKEKQDNIRLRKEVEELTQQLTQQSDYCSCLGAACCTLLWRVSRNEDSIQSIIVGSKVEEFLSLVSNTLDSYVNAYKRDWPDEKSDETQFIHALCGIITNIAASAFGRDYLTTNPCGQQLIDTYIRVLGEAPNRKSARLKNLILMALYNLSINQRGIKYISSERGIIGLLAWLLQDEVVTENRVNTLRLIQSIISEECNLNTIHELLEVLPRPAIEELKCDKNRDIRDLSKEILSDIENQINHEQ